jgi:hypothetical protein
MNQGVALLFFLLFAAALITPAWALYLRHKQRELIHRERMLALEKGVALPDIPDGGWKRPASLGLQQYLLRGLVWLFTGVSIMILVLGMSLSWYPERIPQDQLYAMRQNKEVTVTPRREQGMPWGMALFGLIPAGVGAAYLITYSVEKKSRKEPA